LLPLASFQPVAGSGAPQRLSPPASEGWEDCSMALETPQLIIAAALYKGLINVVKARTG
jgi:hypothetical protein